MDRLGNDGVGFPPQMFAFKSLRRPPAVMNRTQRGELTYSLSLCCRGDGADGRNPHTYSTAHEVGIRGCRSYITKKCP